MKLQALMQWLSEWDKQLEHDDQDLNEAMKHELGWSFVSTEDGE